MRVDVPDDVGFTPNELALIDKAKLAFRSIRLDCYGKTSKGEMFMYDILAAVVPPSRTTPLSIDFKAVNRNLNGHAVIGPEKVLTDKLFRGDDVAPGFFREIQAAVAEFIHCMETM